MGKNSVFCFMFLFLGLSAYLSAGTTSADRFLYTESDGAITITGLTDRTESDLEDIVIPEYINGKPVVRIGEYAFNGSSLTSIVIPKSVTGIGGAAFTTCAVLKTVDMGNSVTEIGVAAFAQCGSLIDMDLPESLLKIGAAAFAYCVSLESVIIPASVISMGNDVFLGCEKLEAIEVQHGNTLFCSVDGVLYNKDRTALLRYPMGKASDSFSIPGSVNKIGVRSFEGCRLASILIPDSVETVEEEAFGNCRLLKSMELPESLRKIGSLAFFSCTALESVSIPGSVSIIEDRTFDGCVHLRSVSLGNSVESVGESAFERCDNLESIILPASLAFIGSGAFNNCRKLGSVTLLSIDPPELEDPSVFLFNATGRQFCVPSGSLHAYQTAKHWTEYAEDIAP